MLDELIGSNVELIKKIHQMAYVYYQNQFYREADTLFRILIQADPSNKKYWKGLAACLQMKKNYSGALKCYQRVKELIAEQADVYVDIHIADCYFALKRVNAGLKTLESIKKIAEKQQDKKVLQHVSFMRSRWKKAS